MGKVNKNWVKIEVLWFDSIRGSYMNITFIPVNTVKLVEACTLDVGDFFTCSLRNYVYMKSSCQTAFDNAILIGQMSHDKKIITPLERPRSLFLNPTSLVEVIKAEIKLSFL